MIRFNKSAGFTLIEMIVYIALIGIVLVAGVDFMWQIINTRVKSQVVQEAQQNARLAMERMTVEIRGAEDVDKDVGDSTFDSHPGKLTLEYTSGNVVIDTTIKSVTIGGQSVNIRKLRITEGVGSPVELTSDRVDVTNLVFTDFTRGTNPDNIYVTLTVVNVNPTGDVKRKASSIIETAISLRQ